MNIHKIDSKLKFAIIITVVVLFMLGLRNLGIYQVNKLYNQLLKIENVNSKQSLYQIKLTGLFANNKFLKNSGIFGISNGHIFINESDQTEITVFVNGWCIRKYMNSEKISSTLGTCRKKINTYHATKSTQIFVVPRSGTYRIELWGAAGGNSAYFQNNPLLDKKHGKGAYTSGDIYLEAGKILYVQVGSKGGNATVVKDNNRFTNFGYPSQGGTGGYNGGGNGYDDPEANAGGGGGGATDIRLSDGLANDFESLKSRIMVAAGAGGMSRYYEYDGDTAAGSGESGSGGTIKGINGKVLLDNTMYSRGATQTSGYKFGIGENGLLCMTTINGLGGGAGGYYGSHSGRCNPDDWGVPSGAGGGSSYVSGCDRCNSISENSDEYNVIHTNNPIHYSKLKFSNIEMKSGEEKMPNPRNGKMMIGNDGDGFARITFLH